MDWVSPLVSRCEQSFFRAHLQSSACTCCTSAGTHRTGTSAAASAHKYDHHTKRVSVREEMLSSQAFHTFLHSELMPSQGTTFSFRSFTPPWLRALGLSWIVTRGIEPDLQISKSLGCGPMVIYMWFQLKVLIPGHMTFLHMLSWACWRRWAEEWIPTVELLSIYLWLFHL